MRRPGSLMFDGKQRTRTALRGANLPVSPLECF